MKNSCVIMLILFVTNAIAQTTVPNGGFENWQNVGNNDEEPTHWNSNKTGGGFTSLAPQTCFQEGNPHSGNYCVKVETKTYFGTAVNGSATTGKLEAPSTNPADGYLHTERADANFNSPFTGRPDSLIGWYKYTSVNGDRPKIKVMLHGDYDVEDPDQGGSAPYMIAVAEFDGVASNVSTWTRFSVPFVYSSSATPDYFLGVVTSSYTQTGGQPGSILWVDDLEAVYCNTMYATDTIVSCGPYTWIDGNTYSVSNSSATHTLTASNGCDSVVSLNLSIIPTPDVGVINQTNYLEASQGGVATYQWLDCDDNLSPIIGETNATINYTGIENYALEVTLFGCVDTSVCSIDGFLNFIDVDPQFKIWPNPVNEFMYAKSKGDINDFNFSIHSLDGKLIYETRFQVNKPLDVSFLSPGYYIAKSNDVVIGKFIKE